MDKSALNLVRVAHVCGEKRALCADVELRDLAVLQPHEVHLTRHSLDVTDPMTANFDDLFALGTRNVVHSQHSCFLRPE